MEKIGDNEDLEVLESRELLLEQTLDFIDSNAPKIPSGDKFVKDLSELNYTLSENCGWIDNVDGLSNRQILQCWQIVEALKNKRFPESLYM